MTSLLMEVVLSDSLQHVALQDKLWENVRKTISTSPTIRSKTLNPMDFLNSSFSEINLELELMRSSMRTG